MSASHGLQRCQRIGGAYLQEYCGTVLSCVSRALQSNDNGNNGDRNGSKKQTIIKTHQKQPLYEVILDDSILFAEGGGQPSDRGTLDSANVVRVERREGKNVHIVDNPLQVGTVVQQKVDWQRRWDHMQHHTSQHLITAVADKMHGIKTVGWQLSSFPEPCIISMDKPIDADTLELIENEVNLIVREHRPVNLHIFDSYEHAKNDSNIGEKLRLGAQFDESMKGSVRVIELQNLDLNLCCGTHVENTAELQSIILLHVKRDGQKYNLHFLSGDRARYYLRVSVKQQNELVGLLSVPPNEHVMVVNRMIDDRNIASKQLARVQKELALLIAQQLSSQNTPVHSYFREASNMSFIQVIGDELLRDSSELNLFVGGVSDSIGCKTGSVVIYFTAGPSKMSIIETEAKALFGPDVFNGRGGGKAGRIQGKGQHINAASIAEAVRRLTLVIQ